MQFLQLRQSVLELLEKNLQKDLSYHSVAHTVDVLQACGNLAAAENVSGDDLLLLQTAALLHDTGFLRTYKDHEATSMIMAAELLPDFGYSAQQILAVQHLIAATRIPQSPASPLAEILCDADLDYLGREDYEPIAHSLFLELCVHGIVTQESQWIDIQLRFLTQHHYFTRTSVALREAGKQRQIERLKGLKG